ncbi:hypothetical protein B0H15DRAFT_602704 [Mycena belliarum]|uniref:Uncharacterized protein n=1 Tax=Mycena belliarum TaxID=1033014 RepID=A0AAD6XK58_9AGAR|nr:hypothetical protein B0H15DRAFT_602704 [Mycena belliae]
MKVANPSNFIPELVLWAAFEMFATCSLVALLTVTLLAMGLRANPTLLNLEIIFIISSSTSSVLIWTGNARNMDPPFSLCLMNASAVMANVPLMAGAALAIVAEVWGTAMTIWYPRFRPVLQWVIWTPFLVLLPYISAIPLFIAGTLLGLKDRTDVYRGSPFYCVLDQLPLQMATSIFGAAFTLIALVLATWTSVNLIATRRRVAGTRFTQDSETIVRRAFAFRVVLFSLFVGAAFVSGIIALSSSFDAIVPDIIVASCGVGAFFIFATSSPIIRFVFFCKRNQTGSSALSTTLTSWQSGPRAEHVALARREHTNEFVLGSIQVERESKPLGHSPGAVQPYVHPITEQKITWEPLS